MSSLLIRNATLVNEGEMFEADVYLQNDLIHTIGRGLTKIADHTVDAKGLYLLPGVIDDQVHFREPGLTHKGEIYTEARAGVAGGVTSFMEMPNTVPNTVTQSLLAEKYARAAQVSLANYSFFMGGTNDNLEEVLKTDGKNVCGIKIFMGSSTGNMLVDNPETLERIFSEVPLLIATHCEYEPTVRANMEAAREKYGENVPVWEHPNIRSAEACYLSSSMAVELAQKHGTRLHILHISTEKETHLFSNDKPLREKRITAEACIHHLYFSDEDYKTKGAFIKWNPAVKTVADREGVWQALLDDRIDVVATDHAPHTLEEKGLTYFKAPSGGPLIQHSLVAMLEMSQSGRCELPFVIRKMCHAPADLFRIDRRGYLREGYFADLVLVDPKTPFQVNKSNILAKCGWSPFEGTTFQSSVRFTIVNGRIVYGSKEGFDEKIKGKRLGFDPR